MSIPEKPNSIMTGPLPESAGETDISDAEKQLPQKPDTPPPPPPPPPPPNGGATAWLQVAGAFFMFFNSW